jgi:UrcA family protein
MKNVVKNFAAVTAIGLGVVSPLCSASAIAVSSADSPPAKLVGYSDLNLDSETGARTLYARLRAASREVCVEFEGTESMDQRIAWARCYSNALSGSVARVNSAVLSSLFGRAQIR